MTDQEDETARLAKQLHLVDGAQNCACESSQRSHDLGCSPVTGSSAGIIVQAIEKLARDID
jgi:hypothetical protein